MITLADPLPVVGTELTLTLPPDSMADLFLNKPSTPFTLTFNWPAADAVLFDDVPPKVEQVVVLDGYLEVQLSEEPDASTLAAITLDGQPLTWALQADGYTVKSDSTLALGSHALAVGVGLLDLQGQALAQPESFAFELGAAIDDVLVYQAPDPRFTPTSTVGNRVGFQGHEKDPETGLVYVRNRYYDPELGRFITADPMGYVDGPSMYQFAGYDPVNKSDPLGLDSCRECTHQYIRDVEANEAFRVYCRDQPLDDPCWERDGVLRSERRQKLIARRQQKLAEREAANVCTREVPCIRAPMTEQEYLEDSQEQLAISENSRRASWAFCCFCGISLPEDEAVLLAVYPTRERDEVQNLYADRHCLVRLLRPEVPRHPALEVAE